MTARRPVTVRARLAAGIPDKLNYQAIETQKQIIDN